MEYIKKNKNLLSKYLLVVISNIILIILSNYYLRSSEYKYLILLIVVVIVDMFIYSYKGRIKYIYYLDFLVNLLVGLISILLFKKIYDYTSALLGVVLANNIIFMRSRKSEKFIKRNLQYLMILTYTLIILFILLFVFSLFR